MRRPVLVAACLAALTSPLSAPGALAQQTPPSPEPAAASAPPDAAAEQPAPDPQAQIDDLKRAIAVRDQVIRNLIQRLERLELAVNELGDAREAAGASAGPAAQQAAGAPPAAQPPPPGTQRAAAAAQQDQELIRAAFERTLIDRGGLLLRPGTFELEPSLSYAHSSSENLVIDGFTVFPVLVVGDIFSERRRRNTATTAITGRLGLPWRSQLEVRLPWIREDASRLTGDGAEIEASAHGLGDVEIAWSRDLPRPLGRGPQLLGSLRWKGATALDPFDLRADEEIAFGTGFETLSASLTGVSVLDPVVLFGTLTYTEAAAERKGENHIDPGDSLRVQFGMALSLNLETSMSLAAELSFTERTRLNGEEVPGTYVNTGTLAIGLSRAFPGGRSLDTNLAIGLSEDSPDVQVGVSVPFRW
ncbi:MAG TPA: hypothetical protein VF322_14220 [Gammaproteobacteria bacterium]